MDTLRQTDSLEPARATAVKLLAYCEANGWAGHDPYDALNSELFRAVPRLDSRWPRLVLTQAMKRSPVNLRRLARVPKTQNPKALALFLSATLKLRRVGALSDERVIGTLLEALLASRSEQASYWCWGYSFPWQTRTLVVPRGAPNLVCTTFVANAVLDAYDELGDGRLLQIAASAADYLVEVLYWNDGRSQAGFSYPVAPHDTRIHNANLLAAAFLARVARHTGRDGLIQPALNAVRYSVSAQRPDGSWPYGELPKQAWIDNFHTGYNLCGLRWFGRQTGMTEFDAHVSQGFEFYRRHFFREDGAPRYFHNRTYPIDIHCVAQSLITLLEFKDVDDTAAPLARSVLDWAMKHMWDERGFFYYRVLRLCTIRTSYMRWSQAWMLLALSTLVSDVAHERAGQPGDLRNLAGAGS